MSKLQANVANRCKLVADLRRELMGPSSESEGLGRDYPCGRYGVGTLFPACYVLGKSVRGTAAAEAPPPEPEAEQDDQQHQLEVETFGHPSAEMVAHDEDDEDEDGTQEGGFDLALANARQPASMAVSFLLDAPAGTSLRVTVTGGRYERRRPEEEPAAEYKAVAQAPDAGTEVQDEKAIPAERSGNRRWYRIPVAPEAVIIGCDRPDGAMGERTIPSVMLTSGPLRLEVLVTSRGSGSKDTERLLTVSLVNRSELDVEGELVDNYCLFQSGFKVEAVGTDGQPVAAIVPYPEVRTVAGPADTEAARIAIEEEESIALLYRNQQTYAIGHGCAADWAAPVRARVALVRTEVMPVVEVSGLTPDIRRKAGPDGRREVLRVPMAPLAGIIPDNDGMEAVREVVEAYRKWIGEQQAATEALPARHRKAAERHIGEALACVGRMDDGLDLLAMDADVREAFRLTNEAILMQQMRGGGVREVMEAKEYATLAFKEPAPNPDLKYIGTGKGNWRPFQIAFMLMNLRSSVTGDDAYRENVELIWFPTGGGKTEAYLGLTAFAVFHDRLTRNAGGPTGTQVLMRYTLRLLTAQQFQRAARLLCAMEFIRSTSADHRLKGAAPISIGLWLGGSTTPNKNSEAITAKRALDKEDRQARNPLLVTQCPWCRARMGPVVLKGKDAPKTLGYSSKGTRVAFVCPDRNCHFGKATNPLPVYVTDEDIYDNAPTLVIGTVDKFARLAHVPRARALFGLGDDGERRAAPPSLIIQDELHLIAGPLGSIVGLFEGLLEELCTDRRGETPLRPKLVCSTATIRRYRSQVKALYARDQVTLFPPPGLDSTDSFFSAPDVDERDEPLPGRLYVGVHAPGHSSMETTQVRTFSALLYGAKQFATDEERDPWWTLLLFYNSLHELGGAITLFNSDIVEYLKAVGRRYAADRLKPDHRYLSRVLELTGRIPSDEVVKFIERLERPVQDGKGAVDACLASNIIEVGVDIDRLSVIGIVNQPKTTAQYIQVTGRVGRRANERPGLVVTLYSSKRPRDRSHYEQFRPYHQRLYAQVEPTGLTPFSPPALDRALHGMMIAWVRQTMPTHTMPDETDEIVPMLERFRDEVLLPRVRVVAPALEATVQKMYAKRLHEWQLWQPTTWQNKKNKGESMTIGLTYPAGELDVEHADRQWPLLGSMRNVDATSELRIGPLTAGLK